MKKIGLLLILSLFMSNWLSSQDGSYPIRLIAKSYKDSIVLRWNVGHVNAWNHSQKNGYEIERMELDDATNDVIKSFSKLSERPVKPWTEQEFLDRTFPGDSMTALAYKCLYQPSEETKESGDLVKQMSMVSADQKGRYTMGLLAADLSPKAASALGVRWVDKNVDLGKKYIYRVYIPSDNSHIITDTAYFILTLDDEYSEGAMARPEAYPADRYVSIRWLTESRYTAYFLQRSSDLRSWKETQDGPIVPWNNIRGELLDFISINDSIPANRVSYYYRIRGINAFGEYSPWSDYVTTEGIEGFQIQQPRILGAENNLGLQVDLTWEADVSMPIAGYYLYHADNGFSKDFQLVHEDLLPSSQLTYTHNRAYEYKSNFYKLIVVYENGEIYSSLPKYCPVVDQAPPLQPSGLIGTIDKDGIVTINWNDNPDRDLAGYFVLMANQEDHEFVNLTPYVITQTEFKDTITLNTLTEKVYYKIQAKDESGKISEFSDTLMLNRPDIIPPSPPVIVDYQVQDSTLMLKWHKSTSKDLYEHVLVRRNDRGEWMELKKLGVHSSEIRTIIPEENVSEYAVIAIDDAGLKSKPSFPVGVKRITRRNKLELEEFSISQEGTSVQLNWSIKANLQGKYFIYRSIDGSPMRRIKTLTDASSSYIDHKVMLGQACTYEIQFQSTSGSKSEWVKRSINIQ